MVLVLVLVRLMRSVHGAWEEGMPLSQALLLHMVHWA